MENSSDFAVIISNEKWWTRKYIKNSISTAKSELFSIAISDFDEVGDWFSQIKHDWLLAL